MIQTVYFKLYCYVKMHKMGKLLKKIVVEEYYKIIWWKADPWKSALETLSWGSVYIINSERDEMEMEMPCGYNWILPNQRSVFA